MNMAIIFILLDIWIPIAMYLIVPNFFPKYILSTLWAVLSEYLVTTKWFVS